VYRHLNGADVQLGQRIYELEEELDEHSAREQDLINDLQSADQAFESAKTHYENLVNALKDARKALQAERDEALAKARKEESGRKEDKEGWKKETKEMDERHRRVLADRDQVCPLSSLLPFSNLSPLFPLLFPLSYLCPPSFLPLSLVQATYQGGIQRTSD
jgi:chromosome segregation ATPase